MAIGLEVGAGGAAYRPGGSADPGHWMRQWLLRVADAGRRRGMGYRHRSHPLIRDAVAGLPSFFRGNSELRTTAWHRGPAGYPGGPGHGVFHGCPVSQEGSHASSAAHSLAVGKRRHHGFGNPGAAQEQGGGPADSRKPLCAYAQCLGDPGNKTLTELGSSGRL